MTMTISGSGTIGGLVAGGLPDGTVQPVDLTTGAPSWDSSGNLSFNSGYGSVATAYGCRAWINFNGGGTAGSAVSIRGSANVSSLEDLGVGYYRVNFSTAMPDANYSCPMAASNGTYYANTAEPLTVLSNNVIVYCWSRGASSSGNTVASDMTTVAVAIFR